ncbi:hypothetical protein CHS0354_002632, partial [Potamilus streckersoni]
MLVVCDNTGLNLILVHGSGHQPQKHLHDDINLDTVMLRHLISNCPAYLRLCDGGIAMEWDSVFQKNKPHRSAAEGTLKFQSPLLIL